MGVRIALAHLKSAAPYSQSRNHCPQKISAQETPDQLEERTWRDRCNVDEKGYVYIPPMAFKLALEEAAKFRSDKLKGNATYTAHFRAGVLVCEPLVLPQTKDDVIDDHRHVSSTGQRGSGKRVWKHFPLIQSWEGKVPFTVLDEAINENIFAATLADAGRFVGIGRFRPQNGGFYGRFDLVEVKWTREA